MQPLHQASALRALRAAPAWRLLSADNAPAAVALLQSHLLTKERKLPASLLVERLGRDLEQLRTEGWDLPQAASAYLTDWLAAGWLERSYSSGGEEEFELTSGAIQAMRFLQGLSEQRAVATESRLAVVIGQLVQLAEQTDSDPQTRVERLLRERARIDAEIEAIRSGRLETLAEDRALERLREILALADELASDFRRVRDEFQGLNRDLRERIVESEGSRGEVLEAVFAGVDLIADSEAGRTFKAFWRLLTDPRESAELEEAMDDLMSRDFVHRLDRGERRYLLGLTRMLLERGGEVHQVLQHFARGLKQFVQTQEFREQRRMTRLLKGAQRRALALKDRVKPYQPLGLDLRLASASLRSLAQLRLNDPSLDNLDAGIPAADTAEISLESIGELIAHSEIDFHRLEDHVQTLLQKRAQVSVAEVLEAFPAEQGLGSLVGYIALGVRHGVVSDARDRVCWRGLDGVERAAHIPRIYFVRGEGDGLD
ncbi:MAG: DUF3375 domain-containing protein [Chromatiaceae bacterium]|jgi:hypothetical protein|nr:DUF3375 domain-containing protein [Chromatiaceae bacterium]